MGADPDYEPFARVAELGSVSAAGRALGLSAPVASKRLARLEARLVNRTTRRTALTGAGQRFHKDVPWRLSGPEGAVAMDLKSRGRTHSSEVERELILAGVGLALRSLWDVSADLAGRRLVRVLETYEGSPDVRICAVHPRSPLTPRRVTAFIDFLRGLYLPRPPWETP